MVNFESQITWIVRIFAWILVLVDIVSFVARRWK